MITLEDVNTILGVSESYKQPERLMQCLLDDDKRIKMFREFLELETDMSYEWFQKIFENEHADRKQKKQDFTPMSVAKLLARLVGNSHMYHEVAAGNGGLLIQAWDQHLKSSNFWTYNPKFYWYHVEELSERSLPFLIFNMAIRGMNGVVLHGDSLTRTFENVYFIRNMDNQYGGFSEVFKLEHSDMLKKEFNIKEWKN